MVDSPGPLDGLGRHRGGAKFTPLGGGAESPKQACMTFPDHSRRASKFSLGTLPGPESEFAVS